MNKILLSNVVK